MNNRAFVTLSVLALSAAVNGQQVNPAQINAPVPKMDWVISANSMQLLPTGTPVEQYAKVSFSAALGPSGYLQLPSGITPAAGGNQSFPSIYLFISATPLLTPVEKKGNRFNIQIPFCRVLFRGNVLRNSAIGRRFSLPACTP